MSIVSKLRHGVKSIAWRISSDIVKSSRLKVGVSRNNVISNIF